MNESNGLTPLGDGEFENTDVITGSDSLTLLDLISRYEGLVTDNSSGEKKKRPFLGTEYQTVMKQLEESMSNTEEDNWITIGRGGNRLLLCRIPVITHLEQRDLHIDEEVFEKVFQVEYVLLSRNGFHSLAKNFVIESQDKRRYEPESYIYSEEEMNHIIENMQRIPFDKDADITNINSGTMNSNDHLVANLATAHYMFWEHAEKFKDNTFVEIRFENNHPKIVIKDPDTRQVFSEFYVNNQPIESDDFLPLHEIKPLLENIYGRIAEAQDIQTEKPYVTDEQLLFIQAKESGKAKPVNPSGRSSLRTIITRLRGK